MQINISLRETIKKRQTKWHILILFLMKVLRVIPLQRDMCLEMNGG